MLYVRMPKERVAVLIGQKGEAKKLIEKRCEVKIHVDSRTGDVAIRSGGEISSIDRSEETVGDLMAFTARDVVKAIARGFSPERAMRLFDDDVYLELLDIRDYAGKSAKHVRRVRSRIIGTGGKTRRIIEEMSEADLSIYGNTVGIIGDIWSLDIAKRAAQMVLEGSEHSTVYRYLEGRRRDLRIAEMGMQ